MDLLGAYTSATKAWVSEHTRASLTAKYEALEALAEAGQAPGQVVSEWNPQDVHQKLLARCQALSLSEEWLQYRLKEGDGLTKRNAVRIAAVLDEFDRRIAEIDKKPAKGKPEDRLAQVKKAAAAAGINGTRFLAISGPIKSPGPLTAEKVDKIQAKVNSIIKEETPVDLFSGITLEANPETGEVQAAPAEPEYTGMDEQTRREVMEALGISDWRPHLETREDVERVLQMRASLIAEMELIATQYQKAWTGLQSEINNLDRLYIEELEAWTKANLPAKKKSITLLYGDLKFRDMPARVSLDAEDDPDGSKFENFLEERAKSDDWKARWWLRPVTKWARDLKTIEADYKAVVETAQKNGQPPPIWPGLKYNPAQPNKFFIGPSLNTVKEKIREQLKEQA